MPLHAFAQNLLQLSNNAMAITFDDIVDCCSAKMLRRKREGPAIECGGDSQCRTDA